MGWSRRTEAARGTRIVQKVVQLPRLSERARKLGAPVPGAGNRPIRLDDPRVGWYVEEGALDIFLFEYRNGEITSSPRHLLRAGPGRLVFGVGLHGGQLAAVAKGILGTGLRRVPLDVLLKHDVGNELAVQVDQWLEEFSAAIASQIEPHPRPTLLIEPAHPEASLEAPAGGVLSTRPGGVVWVWATDTGGAYLGTEQPRSNGTGLVPVTADTWLRLSASGRVSGVRSSDLCREGTVFRALDEFHGLALAAERLNRSLLLADELNEQTARAAHRRRDEELARAGLFTVLNRRRRTADVAGSPLLAALEAIGEHEGIAFQTPSRRAGSAEEPTLQDVLNASGVRSRRVRLASEDRWWVGDSGAMLGFLRDGGQPIALLPGFRGRYRVLDPSSGQSSRLDAVRVRDISPHAWLFYPPLPEDEPIAAKHLLKLAAAGVRMDFGRFAVAGLLASLLLQVPAIAVGILADSVLPAAAREMHTQIIIAVGAFGLVGVLLQMLQGSALMRLEGRAASRLAAAAWDRLLSLRPGFFRNFTAGELAVRMMVFQAMRDQISGVVANALLSLVFLLPTLAILFLYDTTLALISLGMAFGVLCVTAVFGALQLTPLRRRYEVSRRLAGALLQFINGMPKLRSAGAEASAFAAWARGYREQLLAGIQVARYGEHLVAFSAALPALVGAVLFAAVLAGGPDRIDIGDFLVVYALSMTFYAAVTSLSRSFEVIAAVLPGYEQVKPILAALPESRPGAADPGELGGDIRFDRISFRYVENGPLILEDVSFRAGPGEFIAIVGESGSGKSTLMRLALGLEDPVSGGVYYDGRDLAHLNRHLVRRRIGVVMQDGALQPGSILDNIIGMGNDLTIEDAFQAARLADVDEDIDEMPMGLFTMVGNNAATFSGGQVQRIRIASALVRNPRIVFLDEATGWLDAASQARVMAGIESLAATRIVIAHRLSTIRRADRIYVLSAGRVVQQGTFEELGSVEGLFRQLVQRQLA